MIHEIIPPDILMDANQETVHTEIGVSRSVKAIKIQMPKILPCLRCGTSKVGVKKRYHKSLQYPHSFNCECENGHCWDEWLDTEAEAIAAWNERPVVVMSSAETIQ